MPLTTVLRTFAQALYKAGRCQALALCEAKLAAPSFATPRSADQLTRNLRFFCAPSSTLVTDEAFFRDDYLKINKLAEEKLHKALLSESRFQSIDTREDRSDILPVTYNYVGKHISKYRGAFLMKNPNDLSVYYQLFTHVQPKTVLEMGTYTGASAIWYDDTAKSLGLDCHIYSFDIEPALLDEEMKKIKPDTVNFITADTSKLKDSFAPLMLESLSHPWLIVEDSHDSTIATAEYLHQFMKIGDYLVIEDTSPFMLHGDSSLVDTSRWGKHKLNLLKKFLQSPVGQNFKVDSFFTDLYGYNCTWNWHGFLRKCS